jgi:hypothetical protein
MLSSILLVRLSDGSKLDQEGRFVVERYSQNIGNDWNYMIGLPLYKLLLKPILLDGNGQGRWKDFRALLLLPLASKLRFGEC